MPHFLNVSKLLWICYDSPLKRLQLAPNEVFVGLPFRKVGPFIRSQDDSSFYSLFCHLNINYLIGGQIFCES